MSSSDIERTRQLKLRAEEFGINIRSPPAPKPKRAVPKYRESGDEKTATQLLRKTIEAKHRAKSGFSRAFSNKYRDVELHDVYDTLTDLVELRGSLGVASVLVAKLRQYADGEKINTKNLRRRMERDTTRYAIIHIAVLNGHTEMVEVLLPHYCSDDIQTSLVFAMRKKNLKIAELLISHGGSITKPANLEEYAEMFKTCKNPELIGLLLGSGKFSSDFLDEQLVRAVECGSLETVVYLTQAGANTNTRELFPLHQAMSLRRQDLVIVLLLARKRPTVSGLNRLLDMWYQKDTMNHRQKITELLILGGANGTPVARALADAASENAIEFAKLLISHGASIDYEEAKAVKNAIASENFFIAKTLLAGPGFMSAENATECVRLLPRHVDPDDLHFLLCFLLKRGAAGTVLDNALAIAAEDGDLKAAKILLTGYDILVSSDINEKPDLSSKNKKEVWPTASPDYEGALALRTALKNNRWDIACLILTAQPISHESLERAYPSIQRLSNGINKNRLMDKFLSAGFCGHSYNAAIVHEISQPNYDANLIALMIAKNPNKEFNKKACNLVDNNDDNVDNSNVDSNVDVGKYDDPNQAIIDAVVRSDVKLVRKLCKGILKVEIMRQALQKAIEVADHANRLELLTVLLESAGHDEDGLRAQLSAELLDRAILSEHLDLEVVHTLLVKGKPDVNHAEGVVMKHAVLHKDLAVLKLVLDIGQHNDSSIETALKALQGSCLSDKEKTERAQWLF